MKKILIAILLSSFNGYGQQLVWTQKADIPSSTRHSPIGFSINQYGYIATGFNNGTCYNDMWKYDPSTNVWSQVASLPGSGRYGASVFVINSKAYAGIGWSSSNQGLSDFYEYDPIANQWSARANFIGPQIYT
ncbi:MAG TPA: kelch repeat-containing protein, partial [Bacteroidia bacterium]|nr:kelch repeat-containing protein [Bacteroidia bacterium]